MTEAHPQCEAVALEEHERIQAQLKAADELAHAVRALAESEGVDWDTARKFHLYLKERGLL